MKRTLVLFLILTVSVTGIFLPTKKAKGISVLGISGVVDVVIDPVHVGANVAGWIQEWGRYALNKALEIILATLKKRILDRVVNQTVQWIQGNGSPRFVTDTGGFFQDAADAAVGDTLEEVGLGSLCSSNLRTQIRVQLQQTTFRDDVSCTLTEVIDNVESFDDDFRNGSWIAYQETLKPQNNRYGLTLLAKNEALRKKAQKEQEAEQELSAGDGFLSQKRCMQWQEKVAGTSENLQMAPRIVMEGDANFDYLETPDGVRYTGKSKYPQGSNWYCVQSETVTPGSTIADSVSKSIGSDIDYIVNAEDLSTYISAIADALINRLSKEAVAGLSGVFQPSEGSDPRGTTTTNCADLEGPAQDACEEYQDQRDESADRADEGISDLEDKEEEANDKEGNNQLNDIEDCDNLPGFGDVREQCRDTFREMAPSVSVGETHAIFIDDEHRHTGASASSAGEDLESYNWSFDTCPGGSCPSLTDSSGTLTGTEADINGPTYTPNTSGEYRIILRVSDTGGDAATSTLVETATSTLE